METGAGHENVQTMRWVRAFLLARSFSACMRPLPSVTTGLMPRATCRVCCAAAMIAFPSWRVFEARGWRVFCKSRASELATKPIATNSWQMPSCRSADKAGGQICLTVKDNGCGLPADVSRAPGMGLRVMRYRAGLLGGQLLVQPSRHGGVEVVCRLPKPQPPP